MLIVPKKDNVGTEEYYYVGDIAINSLFNVPLSGITEPDSSYFIYHMKGKLWVFEYVVSGSGYIVTEDNTYTVKEGDCYVISENAECYYYADEKKPFKKIWINVTGSLVRHLMHDYGLYDAITVIKYDAKDLFEDILRSFKADKIDFISIQLKIHEIIANISPIHAETANSDIIESVHNYILENIRTDMDVDTLCKNFFISRVHLFKLFKSRYGISPYKFIMKMKMESAASMLVNTDMTIKEISFLLSYDDPHHFSKVFNSHYNCSPRDYRLNNKAKSDTNDTE